MRRRRKIGDAGLEALETATPCALCLVRYSKKCERLAHLFPVRSIRVNEGSALDVVPKDCQLAIVTEEAAKAISWKIEKLKGR